MKQSFSLLCIGLVVLFLIFTQYALAQTANTLDPFIAQITSSSQDVFVGGVSGDGRFVVFESSGDLATLKPGETTKGRNNSDGNREIFLYDYAQRRIFQITNTTNAPNTSASACPTPTPTPTPTPSPTPTATPTATPVPTPTPIPSCSIGVDVSNNRPQISFDGRWIVFSSNASTPGNFSGSANAAALAADGNQEVWLYRIPDVAAANLSSGTDPTDVELDAGTFTQVTNTPASRLPTAGTTTLAPFVADDNREATINDDGSVVAFTSTRNLVGTANNDFNPEIFVFNRTTGGYAQVTSTTGTLIFNENPSLSGDGSRLAFISNANIPETGGAGNNSDGNAEVYLATIAPGTPSVSAMRQVTRTAPAAGGTSVNVLSPGRRISRNGNLIAFESTADLAGAGSLQASLAIYIYNVSSNTFTQVGSRTASGTVPDLLRFPTFTGDNSTLLFTSALNLKADGTIAATASEGLNPPQPNANDSRVQLWAVPVGSPSSVTRVTNNPVAVNTSLFGPPGLVGFTSNTLRRIVFTLARTELGGGNTDNSAEAFYLLTPPQPPTADQAVTVNFSTGASDRPVTTPSPTPTPPAVAGLAPAMLGLARSSVALAPSNQNAGARSLGQRRPSLPIELNGVSVSINGAAAGLYFVGSSPNQINFVVPPGLAANSGTNTYPVVVNNNGTLLRSTLFLQTAQPDIFTDSMAAAGRAFVFDVTNPSVEKPEPFTITDATVLRVVLTGVQGVTKSQVSVRIGTTDITGASILTDAVARDTPGFYQIDFKPPTSLAGAGDVPIIVTVTINSVAYTSRPADTAPRIRIQ